jgi:transposase-like protein
MTSALQDQTQKKKAVKSYPVCPKCKRKMDIRITRSIFVKIFLFWLPIRRYKCSNCGNKRHVLYR